MATMAGTFTLLYDSLCPICRREVHWLKRRDRDGRLSTIDIAAPGFDPAPLGLSAERVVARLHGIQADGTVVEGMAAMRGAWRAVGLGWLIAPTGWPLLRYLYDGLYVVFARYRVPLGRLFGRRAASCDTDRCASR